MSIAALKPSLLQAEVAAIRKNYPDQAVVGFHAKQAWTGPPSISVDGVEHDVVSCRSELEMRERLSNRAGDAKPLIILTPLRQLGDDVLARLVKRRLLTLEPWRVVADLFQARDVDPRFSRYPWMATTLIDAMPAGGYDPAPGGVLSLEMAWGIVLKSFLKLEPAQPDVHALLDWTLNDAVDLFAAAPESLRSELPRWLSASAGSVVLPILHAIERGHGADAVPLGLVCAIVHDPSAAQDIRLAQAAVRLESFIGQGHTPLDLQRWGEVAQKIVLADFETQGLPALQACLMRAEEILRQIGAHEHAHRSRILPSGLEQRIEHWVAALDQGDASAAFASLRDHALLPHDESRAARVDMLDRLRRWLRSSPTEPGSFGEAATRYAHSGSFVDWARSWLRGGDANPALSAASDRALQQAQQRRETENRSFGRLLQGWLQAGSAQPDLLPIEDVLRRVVAPLAKEVPVLLVVLDGLSTAVFHEITADLSTRGWVTLRPDADTPGSSILSAPPVIATIPTVTDVCRPSLLSGRLAKGVQSAESKGFSTHADLVAASSSKHPPILFHKAELSPAGQTDLAAAVRAEVASPERKVVGVVLNAVDDQLMKADQIRPRWTVEYIQYLLSLLQAAQDAGRVVIITADHGHILDLDCRGRKGGQSDRWRMADGEPAEDEVLLQGPRVSAGVGGRVIAPWSELVRYCGKKNGYHGGASPQEVVVPLGVFAPGAAVVPGWTATTVTLPAWWHEEAAPIVLPSPPPAPKRRAQVAKGQVPLFPQPVAADPAWIDALFASSRFAEQRQAASRVAPSDEHTRTVLLTLYARGGKLTYAALEQRLGVPALRLRGLITGIRRILNVEGYDVLAVDEETSTIELNTELLSTQFEL